jgi:hypothetical protein
MGNERTGSDPRSFTTKDVAIRYLARDVWKPLHASDARFRVAVAHRRAGKTVAFINEALSRAFKSHKSDQRYGYIAPFLSQAKAIAWDYVRLYSIVCEPVRFHESELRADFANGARIRIFGADNPNALRGLYFDGVILDEFGDMDPRVWSEVIRPTLSDRNGWAAFAGTPRGRNHFYDLAERARRGAPDWAHWELKASRTGLLSSAELSDARASMDEAAYAREYECSFDASVEGAYYTHEMAAAAAAGRICRLPIEPTVKVDTAWDIGIDDATAVWFVQDVGRERRLIDYLEVSGEGLAQLANRLDKKGYRYGRHILPHDADARERSTGQSWRASFEALGFRNVEIVPRTDDLIGAINATRLMIPRCWFDDERCLRGLEALKQYRREWDGKRQTWRERPLHDWSSHGADAFRALALSRQPIDSGPRWLEIPDYGIV